MTDATSAMKFLSHLKAKLNNGLMKWEGSEVDKSCLVASVLNTVARDLQCILTTKLTPNNVQNAPIKGAERFYNRMYSDCIETFEKSLILYPGKVSNIIDNKLHIIDLLRAQAKFIQDAKKVYVDISTHHKRLQDNVTEEKTDVMKAVDSNSFVAYADAAKAMGDRVWVIEANRFMFHYCINYYRLGGSKKLFCKSNYKLLNNQTDSNIINQANTSSSTSNQSFDLIPKDIFENRSDKRIKVLDVGSCYNPFAKLDEELCYTDANNDSNYVNNLTNNVAKTNNRYMDVTAIDLCPADTSKVYTCDFLKLNIISDTNMNNKEREDVQVLNIPDISNIENNAVLGTISQLTEHSFDVITMCLVSMNIYYGCFI